MRGTAFITGSSRGIGRGGGLLLPGGVRLCHRPGPHRRRGVHSVRLPARRRRGVLFRGGFLCSSLYQPFGLGVPPAAYFSNAGKVGKSALGRPQPPSFYPIGLYHA